MTRADRLLVFLLLLMPAAPSAQSAPVAPREKLRAEADTLYARQDWARAAAAYGRLTRQDPENPTVWYRLGVSQAGNARWSNAIAAYRRAEALGIPPAFSRYNVACAFARSGQPDSALTVLASLAAGGYAQVATIENDTDLTSLRAHPGYAAVLERVRRNATPCAFAPESRQFDFWIGEWEVRNNQGSPVVVGDSRVELILEQCVLLENWTARGGGSGKSLNAYNPQTRCWQQNWMDTGGRVTNYGDGRFVDGVMTFLADGVGPQGRPQRLRLSFHDLGAGRVRQHGEASSDSGATWRTTYDFLYTRKGAAK